MISEFRFSSNPVSEELRHASLKLSFWVEFRLF